MENNIKYLKVRSMTQFSSAYLLEDGEGRELEALFLGHPQILYDISMIQLAVKPHEMNVGFT
jgi:hypothetical protein